MGGSIFLAGLPPCGPRLEKSSIPMKNLKIDPQIFWPSLLGILSMCLASVIWPDATGEALNSVMAWVVNNFGWAYLVVGLGMVILLLWLAMGRYGGVRFGDFDEKPEFATMTWLSMLFCAGIGSSLVYWSIIEPIYYMQSPPFGLESGSPMAAEWAATYGAFHWGITSWAWYTIATIPIAYSYYVRKESRLNLSMASKSVLGKRANGPLGKIMDVTVMFGIIGGVGTSLGLGTPMIAACLGKIFHIPQSFWLNIIILVIWSIIFGTSVWLGLKKGIARLSDLNICLALGLALFVLVAGPTAFILNTFTNSLSLMFDNYFRMSLWTDPVAKSGFPQSWTIFYWAWAVGYSPMMGLFVARISRGRTIRELIVGMCLWGPLGCWIYFAVFGCYSIHVELYGAQSMTQLMADQGPAQAITTILASLPMGSFLLPLFVVLMFVFLATTLDSSAYILASVSTRELHSEQEPARWNRLLWAVILAFMAVMMFSIGGLKVIQASSIVLAFPLMFALLVLVWSFLKSIKEDFGELPSSPQLRGIIYENGERKQKSDLL